MDLKDLTFAGWMLLIFTIVGALGLGIPLLVLIDQKLPDGRYPKIFFMIPTIVIGATLYFGGRAILQRMGKPITRVR